MLKNSPKDHALHSQRATKHDGQRATEILFSEISHWDVSAHVATKIRRTNILSCDHRQVTAIIRTVQNTGA